MREFFLRSQLRSLLERLPKRTVTKINTLFSDPANIQTLGLWTSAVIAALISVLYAKLFRLAESGFHRLLSSSGHPYLIFLISPVLFVLAWYVVHKFAPEAAGSGIPQIMAANELEYSDENKRMVDRLLSLKTAFVKILSSLLCVLGGGAIGREGPTLQICTSVFHFFGQQIRRLVPGMGEHTLVVAGAAAGLASAFNTPLGGIVYAIEELGLVHFHKVRTALLSGVIVSGLIAQWSLGSYLYLGFPALMPMGFSFLPVAIVCGVVTGVFGAWFGRLLLFFLKRRLAVTKVSYFAAITVCCGLVVAGLAVLDDRSSGTGINVIMGFLFNKDSSSVELIVLRYIATLVSYLSGAAGGIFSPSLAMGGTVGSFLGRYLAPDHSNLMVLLGMIGFLTGVTRTPFTSFILVLEMTDRHLAIFPMMIAALSAHWISRVVDAQSFYEHVKVRYLQQPSADPLGGRSPVIGSP